MITDYVNIQSPPELVAPWLPSGATEKHSLCCLELAIATHGQESKRAKLVVLYGWVG